VKDDRIAHELDAVVVPTGGGHTTRQVRTPRAVPTRVIALDDDDVAVHGDLRSMRCSLMEFGCPATRLEA